ncbi:MAG TPA: hypothetical protein VN253_08915 [Kofleriaceae bacterium]|nr:hypothetical protein [Kofleriaceae bacterium]
MADVHGRSAFAGHAPKIAIGAAVAALLTSVTAVIVVATRGAGAPQRASGGVTDASAAASAVQRVAASDVAKLKRETISVVRDAGKVVGVKVVDGEIRKALGFEPDDVIAALSGRTIKREYDVYDAVRGISFMDASAIYVELLRGGTPMLLRWQLDGDLRSALRNGSLGTPGSLGGSPSDPYGPGSPDPLVDTIKKIDDRTYEVPRSTVDRVFSSAPTYARTARTLPSHRSGGFLVFGVRPGTLVSAIGIQSGDAVRAINGHEVNTIDEAIELYQQIKDAKEWRIDITHRGRPELITIAIK